MRPLTRFQQASQVPLTALVAGGPALPCLALDVLIAAAALGRAELALGTLVAAEGGRILVDPTVHDGAPDATPRYRAPEGGDRDASRAGVYSAAAIAVCVALGRTLEPAPGTPTGHPRWLSSIQSRLGTQWDSVPGGLQAAWLLVRCLAYDPEDRPEPGRIAVLAGELGIAADHGLASIVGMAPPGLLVTPPRASHRAEDEELVGVGGPSPAARSGIAPALDVPAPAVPRPPAEPPREVRSPFREPPVRPRRPAPDGRGPRPRPRRSRFGPRARTVAFGGLGVAMGALLVIAVVRWSPAGPRDAIGTPPPRPAVTVDRRVTVAPAAPAQPEVERAQTPPPPPDRPVAPRGQREQREQREATAPEPAPATVVSTSEPPTPPPDRPTPAAAAAPPVAPAPAIQLGELKDPWDD